MVAIYEYNKKVKQLMIKKMLHGHTDAVISLAASPGKNVNSLSTVQFEYLEIEKVITNSTFLCALY